MGLLIIKNTKKHKKMRTYDFNYEDNEGDEFQSNGHKSLRDAKKQIEKLRKRYDGDFTVTETWIYDNGEFVGRWD